MEGERKKKNSKIRKNFFPEITIRKFILKYQPKIVFRTKEISGTISLHIEMCYFAVEETKASTKRPHISS